MEKITWERNEEYVAVFQKATKAGDTETRKMALHCLVEANRGYIDKKAFKYSQRPGVQLTKEELFNEGFIGLVRAAEKYDTSKGVKFISYAGWWIKQKMMRAIQDFSGLMRIPNNRYETLHAIWDTEYELYLESLRQPTLNEISERSGIEVELVQALIRASGPLASLDNLVGGSDEGTSPLLGFIADPDSELDYQELEGQELLQLSQAQLDPLELQVFNVRFVEGQSIRNTCKKLRMGHRSVRVLTERSKKKATKILVSTRT